jgi:hypothetical protein
VDMWYVTLLFIYFPINIIADVPNCIVGTKFLIYNGKYSVKITRANGEVIKNPTIAGGSALAFPAGMFLLLYIDYFIQ